MYSGKTMETAELPQPQPLRIPGQFEPLLDDVQAAHLLGLHPKTLQTFLHTYLFCSSLTPKE